jgi:hypothetical protein
VLPEIVVALPTLDETPLVEALVVLPPELPVAEPFDVAPEEVLDPAPPLEVLETD